MKNKKIKFLPMLTLVALAVFAITAAGTALAEQVTGYLSTGVSTQGVVGTVISPPAITPPPGTYASVQNVTLSAAGSTSVHYTLNGDNVSCSTGNVYSAPISFSVDTLILAISCYPNSVSSTVASYAYVITAPQVQIVSGGGGGGGGGPIQTYLKEDTNRDGKVDIMDFNTLMVNWGETGAGNIADFNGDGKVDILDFNLLMVNWTL